MNGSRLLKLCIGVLGLAIVLLFTGGHLWAADEEIIIDNGYTGTSQSGSWYLSTAPDPYEGDSVYANGSNTNSPTYTWQAILPRRGTYNVYLWWTVYRDTNGNTNRSANAPLDIQDKNGTHRVTVNQQEGGGQWNKLGTFSFDTIGTVILMANASGYTFSADAVRFVYVPDDTVIVDNGAPGTTATGTWSPSSAANPFGVDSYYAGGSSTNSPTYTWQAALPQRGTYNVYLWWTVYRDTNQNTNRSDSVPVDIQDRTGTQQVIINQQQGEGQWNWIGTYSFDTTGTVTLYANADGYNFSADAVQFEYVPDDTVTIDNGDAGTAQSGTWSPSIGPDPYGGGSIYAGGSSTNPPTYTWQAALPQQGTYNVYLWWTVYRDANGNTNRSANAPADIQDRNGTHRVTVNQQEGGGQWNKLGAFSFDTSGSVTLTANASGYTFSADAVRFVYVPDDEVVINNGDTGTTQSGDWYESYGPNPFGVDSYYAAGSSTSPPTYTWQATLPQQGTYDVYLWWTVYRDVDGSTNRSASVPVNVLDETGSHQVVVNQQEGGGQWNKLGAFTFDTTGTVTLTADADGYTFSADTVKFVYVPDEEVIIDNEDPGATQTGSWSLSLAPSPYGVDSVYANGSSTNPPTYTWQATLPEPGAYNVYLWWTVYRDANGNTNNSATVPVSIQDRTGTQQLTINQQEGGGQWNKLGTYTFDTTGTVTLTANATGYTFSADAVKFALIPDTTPPTGTISINSGASSTNSTGVTLTLGCSDNSSGCSQMQFSNDNTSWSTAESYSTSKAWTLSPVDGSKTVYVKYKDAVGNWSSSSISDSIVLDTTPPSTSASPQGGNYPIAQSVTLTCSDGTGSGCAQIYYTTDGSTPTTNSSIYSSPISITAPHTTLKYFAKDVAGSSETPIKVQEYYIGNTPPVAYIDSISPNPATTGQTVSFTGHGTDSDGTITGYNWRSSIDGQLSTSASFNTASLGAGNHTIYFKVQDNAGVWSTTEATSSLVITPSGPSEEVSVIKQDCTGYSPSNRCFQSLAAWQTAFGNISFTGCTTGDLTCVNKIAVARIEGTWTTADTSALALDGWTTDSSRYVRIYTAPEARHQGKWTNTGVYRLVVSNNIPIDIMDGHVRIEGLQVRVYSVNGSGQPGILVDFPDSNGEVQISDTIVRGYASAAYNYHHGIEVYGAGGSGVVKLWNNIVYDFQTSATSANCLQLSAQNFTIYAYNNTLYNCKKGIAKSYPSVLAKNNIVQACTVSGYAGTFASGSDYNISNFSDAPGTHSKNSVSVQFVDSANRDLHLSGTDTVARDAGVSLSADQYLAFSSDLKGAVRPSGTAWDIGADEVDVTPPTGTISINSGAAWTRSTAVTLSLSCSDDSSGCAQMQFSNDNASWSTLEPYTTSKAWTLSPIDGSKTVYVKYKDAAGISSTDLINDSIGLDTTPPTVSANPPGGTYSTPQLVTLTCSDGAGSGCSQIYYTTDGSTPTTSSSVYSSAIYIAATTTLKFFAKDLAGNPDPILPEHIVTHTYTIGANAPPVAYIDSISPNPAATGQTVNFTGHGTDSDGTIIGYSWTSSIDGQLSTFASFSTALLGAGNHTISFKVQDNLGAWSTEATRSLVIVAEDVSVIKQDCTGYSPSNRCFQSLAAWQAAFGNISFAGCTTGDLTCVNKIAVARIEGTWTNADTSALALSGWTTDSSRYVRIYTAPEARHQGKWTTSGGYRLEVSNNIPIDIMDGHVRIEGLQVSLSGVNGDGQSGILVDFPDANGEVEISDTIVKGPGGTTYNYHNGIEVYGAGGSGTVKLWNNIVYDFQTSSTTSSCLQLSAANFTIYAYNNTIYNCKKGISKSNPTVLAKNNIVQACTTSGFNGAFATGSDYNVSNFSDAPGANSKNSSTVQFVDSANRDLRLSGTDTVAKDAGVSLSTDQYLAFSADLEGAVRPSGTAWDIGADEADVTPPTGTMVINEGAEWTRSTAVTLSLSCSDDSSGCAQMQFSNDNNSSWSPEEAYTTTKEWTLSPGDGEKRVYVRYKDAAGNPFIAVPASIKLDTTLPTTSATPPGGSYPDAQSVTLTCSDGAGSGCAQIYYGFNENPVTTLYAGSIPITTRTTLKYYAKDVAGNSETPIKVQEYYIGNTPPVAYIDSISPNPATTGQAVEFQGHGTDSDGTIIGYSWTSDKDGQLSTSASFSTTTLTTNTHTISFKVQDNAGAWSNVAASNLTITSSGPSEEVSVIRQDCTGYSKCFTSLAAWQTAFGNISFTGCTTGDLTCVNKIAVARIEGTWTNADTSALALSGWTTDSSRYVRIYTAPEARHQGKWTTGAYRLEVSNNIPIDIMDGNVRIDGLQVRLYNVNASGESGILVDFPDSNGEIQISDTIVKGPGSTTYNYHNGIEVYGAGGSGVVKLWNNIVYDFQTSSTTSNCLQLSAQNFTIYAYNNTLYNCKKGISKSNPTVLAKNNIVQACTANGFSGTFATGSDYNISNFSDAPGANSKNGVTVQFIDSANRDLRLSGTDTVARDAGVDLSTDQYLAFSYDVDGSIRPSGTVWDIGADEADNMPPTGTIVINEGAEWTRTTAVTLTLSCSDDNSGCAQMQFSNDNNSWSTLEPYTTSKAWTLTSGDNPKTVYVKYQDGAGNWSTITINDSIGLDTTPPTVSATPPGGTYSIPQSVTLTCSDGAGSGCSQIYYTRDGSDPTTSSSVYSSAIYIATTTTLKFVAKDLAGNPDPILPGNIVTQTYTIGANTPPVAYIDSISPNPATAGQAVEFQGHGTDSDGTIIGYNWRSSTGEQLSTSASFSSASLAAGNYTIYFKVQDNLGVWSNEASSNLVITSSGPPEDVSVIRQSCTGYSKCFQSLAAWEAAFGSISFTGCTTGDLTCVNKIAVARIEGTWTNADTAALVLSGWTTDSSRYVRIYTAPEARHQGKWTTTGAYRLEVSNDIPIDIMEGNVRIEGLQIYLSGVNASGESGILVDFPDANGEVQISNTLVKGPGGTTYDYHNGIEVYKEGGTQASGVVKLWNNIVYDFQTSATTSSCLQLSAADFTIYAYNNTLYNCKKGIYKSNPVVLAKNNIVQASTVSGYSGTFASGSDYNVSNSSDAPGTHSKNSVTVKFVDSANRDLHLSGTDVVAREAGVSLSGDQYLAFSYDVEGSIRPNGTAWDVGADEYLDLAAPTVPTGLQARAASPTQINLSWNPSTDDVEVAGYHVYRNTALVATVTTTSYSDTGLTASTTYSYTVDAFDAVPNTSAQSSPPVQATTLPSADTTPPTGTIVINGGAASTRSTAVTLTLSCSDSGSGCAWMQFSNDNASWSTLESYTTSKAWTLSPGDNPKTVRVIYKDWAGNPSIAYPASILLDTTPPTTTATPPGGNYTTPQSVTLTCTDGTGSGCSQIYYTTDGNDPTTSSSVYTTQISITAPRTTLKYVAKDLAGNPDPIRTEHIKTEMYYIGNAAPVAYIDSISPSSLTVGQLVTFTGHGTDADGTIRAYEWTSSKDGPLGAANQITTTLTAGNHTISFRVQDDSEEWSAATANSTRTLTVAPGSAAMCSDGVHQLGTSNMVIQTGRAHYTYPGYEYNDTSTPNRPALTQYPLTPPSNITDQYPLTRHNTEYVLQYDVTAVGTAFTIEGDNIVLNLNGHTVTYNNSGAANVERFGVHIKETSGRFNSVINGKIVEGGGTCCYKTWEGGTVCGGDDYGYGCNPIYAASTNYMEIAGVEVEYHSSDTAGIYANYASHPIFHHNTIHDTGYGVHNRHQGIRAINSNAAWDGIAHNNHIVRTRHQGIVIGKDDKHLGEAHKVYENEVHIESVITNSIGIGPGGGAAYRNKVYGVGAHPVGIWPGRDIDVYSNYIEVQSTSPNPEYGDASEASGIRMIWGNYDVYIFCNTISVRANSAQNGFNTPARAFSVGLDQPTQSGQSIYIHHNVVSALNDDGETKAAGLGVVFDGDTSKDDGHCLNTWSDGQMNLVFEKNEVRSNWANVLLADNYGCAGGYPKFIENTFIKDPSSNSKYHTIRSEYSSRNSTGIFISNIMQYGASMDDVYLEWDYTNVQNEKALKEIWVGWRLTINVKDSSGNAVSGATVTLKDSTGNPNPVFTGTTDSSGKVRTDTEAIQFRRTNQKDYGNPMPVNNDAKNNGYKVTLIPYTLTVTKGGASKSVPVSFTGDQEVTVTLPL